MKENQNQRSSTTDGTGRPINGHALSTRNNTPGSNKDEHDESPFPGYPHYPPSEDIMSPDSKMQRVPVDVENLATSGNLPKKPETATDTDSYSTAQNNGEDEIRIVPGTDADVSREDLRLLNSTEGSYAQVSSSSTVTGEDLDVPGADQDDPNEDIGEEDEENNYYSLGGDNHDNLEGDPTA